MLNNVPETKLAWLAGIIDGEGCIQMRYANRPENTTLQVRVMIGSVSTAMIDEVRTILIDLGLVFSTHSQPAGRRTAFPNSRKIFRLEVCRKRHVKKLLGALRPYLINKAPEATAALEYLNRACAVDGNYCTAVKDIKLMERIKHLKKIA